MSKVPLNLIIGLLCLYTTWAVAQNQCPPVTPKNRLEVAQIAAASNKQVCLVRDVQTGQLYSISKGAPPDIYTPLVGGPQPPAPVKQTSRTLAHGPSNPLLYPMIAGAWRGSFCGLDVGTLQLTAAGSLLTGQFIGRSIAKNQDCDATQGDICYGPPPQTKSCQYLEPRVLGDAPVQQAFATAGFDGQVLWIPGAREVQMRFAGGTLSMVDSPGEPPTVFRRIQ